MLSQTARENAVKATHDFRSREEEGDAVEVRGSTLQALRIEYRSTRYDIYDFIESLVRDAPDEVKDDPVVRDRWMEILEKKSNMAEGFRSFQEQIGSRQRALEEKSSDVAELRARNKELEVALKRSEDANGCLKERAQASYKKARDTYIELYFQDLKLKCELVAAAEKAQAAEKSWEEEKRNLLKKLDLSAKNRRSAETERYQLAIRMVANNNKERKYNWFEASHECARQGLRLVEVRDAAKNKELLTTLESYIGNPKNFWIGANDEYNTDKDLNRPFYWSSGQCVIFSNWAKGEPNNSGSNEHCVHLWTLQRGSQWNDRACTTKYGFICEKPV
ncbi:C-type lectin domain family 4 member F-like [Musca vetustissima]|uniref:C-type lectin domain family 4 member F-like n=1 Tax=Musca vetustissima TaxID=27455 RepID=UPI002AB62381|nr:C-type lectin domain family 4 member F-like [Musca vetustissima]